MIWRFSLMGLTAAVVWPAAIAAAPAPDCNSNCVPDANADSCARAVTQSWNGKYPLMAVAEGLFLYGAMRRPRTRRMPS